MISTLLLAGSMNLVLMDRATVARAKVEPKIRAYFQAAKIQYPPQRIFLRAFKADRKLEVWGANSDKSTFRRLANYSILAASGKLGPKRQAGDNQVPEGW